MDIRSENHLLVVGPASQTFADRQAKAVKGRSMMAAGLRCFRTLSAVSQKRPQQQRAPAPQIAPVHSPEEMSLQLAPVSSSEQKQELSLSSSKMRSSPRSIHRNESALISTCVSHLQGIHFVSDSNQDPELDADESTMSWPQSVEDEKSSSSLALDDTLKRLSCGSYSFQITLSEQCISPNTIPTTPSEHSSSMSDLSLARRISQRVPLDLLANRASRGAPLTIDRESLYAPYAPTSPLSVGKLSDSQSRTHDTSTTPFSILSALRSTLPSKIPKAKVKTTMPRQLQHIRDQQVTCESGGLESYSSSSLIEASSLQTCLAVDSILLAAPRRERSLDQPSRQQLQTFAGISDNTAHQPSKFESQAEQIGWPEKHVDQRRCGVSSGGLSSIPFPGSDQSEHVFDLQSERKRAQSCISNFRSQINNFWSLPINRLRTSSSLSTVIRGIRPRKSRHPSDTSFEPRPFSIRTDSSYEILDSSAVPAI